MYKNQAGSSRQLRHLLLDRQEHRVKLPGSPGLVFLGEVHLPLASLLLHNLK